jgi:hypothetical protein
MSESNAESSALARPGAVSSGISPAPRGGQLSDARSPMQRLQGFLEKLASGGFFGKVVVSFQNGKVCDVRIEQTKKLEEL